MKIKNIKEKNLISLMTKALSSEEQVSAYHLYRNIVDSEGCDNFFVIYAFNHLSRRGSERLNVGNKDYWLESLLNLICRDEELFWTIMENKTCFIGDEEAGIGYFLTISASIQEGHIINKIYVKTLLKLNKNIYMRNTSLRCQAAYKSPYALSLPYPQA